MFFMGIEKCVFNYYKDIKFSSSLKFVNKGSLRLDKRQLKLIIFMWIS